MTLRKREKSMPSSMSLKTISNVRVPQVYAYCEAIHLYNPQLENFIKSPSRLGPLYWQTNPMVRYARVGRCRKSGVAVRCPIMIS
jgi:hypothetical protein